MEQSMQWFVFFKDQLLLKKEYTTNGENKYGIPHGVTPPVTPAAGCKIHEVTLTGGKKVKACALGQPVPETEEWVMTGLRASYDYLPLADYQAAGKAFQILYWDSHSRFCPVCGTPMEQKEDIMKRCPKCGREVYPSISTAILVLVRKEDSLLLVHARNFKGTFNSLVAGFLETGETLEECVAREVKEETGLDIVGCRYLFSIPNLYPYSGFEVHTVDMFFECLTESFDGAKAEDDAAEIIILPANQLNPDDFGLQSIKKAVDRYIK